MSDDRLRLLERRWHETDAPDDEGRLLTARVRAGQLSNRALFRAALFGSPAARLAVGDLSGDDNENLTQEEMNEVLRLVFRDTEVPARTREFLDHLVQHDQEARATLTHYGLVQEGDKAPPDTSTALKALTDDLRENSNHREAIAQMNRPILQLIPVYKPEGTGFQRMVNALDNHPREGQVNTFVIDELTRRWGINAGTSGKIVGWQVVVVEGDKELPEEKNPHRNEPLGEQLRLWQEECEQRGLELSDNRSYALLQMREIMTAPAGTPLRQLGLDPNTFTVLKDSTRQPWSLVPGGAWPVARVSFDERYPEGQRGDARFRLAVVVKKILYGEAV
jgi:hypothetical protein